MADDSVEKLSFNIPQQRADLALTRFAEQANLTTVFPFNEVRERHANRLVGEFSLQEGIDILLEGTGLKPAFKRQTVLSIVAEDKSALKGEEMKVNKKASVGAFLASIFAASGAVAQNETGEVGATVLEEIVVTAQRRTESLQRAPIAISAFSGEQLLAAGIENSLDLQQVVPALVVSDFARSGNVTLRGVGAPFNEGPGADNSVSTYVDGVYQSRFSSAIVELLDIERIEVLRGPQGTLYGRNSTGGAIKYISNEPGNEFGGETSILFGNYDLVRFKAQVDIPLIEDKFLLRAAAMRTTRDGYTKELSDSSDRHDREDYLGVLLTLKYMPSDTLEIILRGGFSDDNGDISAWKFFDIDPDSLLAGATQIDDPRTVISNTGPRLAPAKSSNVSATVNWDLNRAMLTSITAYTDTSVGPFRYDVDATDIPLINNGQTDTSNGLYETARTFTQELLLTSQAQSDLGWGAGVYFILDDPTWFTGIGLPLLGIPFIQYDSVTEVEGYAAFGNVNYDLTEKWRLGVGLRYSSESKKFTSSEYSGFVLVAGPTTAKNTWDAWTPKVSLDYALNDDVMFYVSASSGFKSGAFNSVSVGAPAVDPEFNDVVELGVKSMLMNDRLRFNIAAFRYDYKDMQVNGLDPRDITGNLLQNAGEAEIQGVEFEISVLPSERLRLDVNAAWLDAEYVEFLAVAPSGEIVNLAGNRLPNSPEFTANVMAEYTQTMGRWGNLTFRTNYYYSDEKFFSEINAFNAHQEAYSLWNARISLEPMHGNWSLSVFGNNLTDELVLSQTINSVGLFGVGYVGMLNAPRTYGAELRVSF